MRKLTLIATVLSAVLSAGPAAAAPRNTEAGFIGFISGGWVNPHLRVQLANLPNINPDACPIADGYMTDPADPGNQLFNSMLLSAFMANKRVRLTLDGCTGLRPGIISVQILPD